MCSAGPCPGASMPTIMPRSTRTTTSFRQPSGVRAVSRCNLLATTRLVRYRAAPVEGSFRMKVFGRAAAAACLAALPAMAQQLAPSPTLDAVKARGNIECGVHLGLPGFSYANDKGEWSGLDVDYCRSLAAAVLGDATKVKYTPTSVQQRWPVLQSGQVDGLSANTTITFSRNATLGVDFQGINSNDPEGPVARWGDERWQLIVRWVLNAQIAAEALGITSKNVDEMKAKSTSAEVRRLLGVEGKFGEMMGLSNDWAYNIVKQVGNYGESYERTVGMASPLKLPRGRNELWTKGGLLYTPPFQ